MRRAILPLVGLSLAAFLLNACGETYRIDVTLKASAGLDLAGSRVSFDGGEAYPMTNGRLTAEVTREPGGQITVTVLLPPHLQPANAVTAKTFPLAQQPDGTPAPISFVVSVERKIDEGQKRYMVEVQEGCSGQEISIDGEVLGEVDEDGMFSRAVTRAPGKRLSVILVGSDDCGERRCAFELGAKDRLVVDELCTSDDEEEEEEDAGIQDNGRRPTPSAQRDASVRDAVVPVIVQRDATVYIPPPPPPQRDAGPPDAGRPDAGRPDSGVPPIIDAGRPDAGRPDSGVPPIIDAGAPDAGSSKPPPGAVQVNVTCVPAGLELYVDGKPALASCGQGSAVWVMPGTRVFRLQASANSAPCPGAKPITSVITKKGQQSLNINVDCRVRNCVASVRDAVAANKTVADADVLCLSSVAEGSADFTESRILLSHVYDAKKKDPKRAEDVLVKLVETIVGNNSAEAHYRLADLFGRRKEFEKQRRHADQAWILREQFNSAKNGTSRILGVRKLRGAAFEGLFYAVPSNRTYFDRALAEYTSLETAAAKEGTKNDGEKWLKLAKEGKARLDAYEKGSKTTLQR